MKGTSTAPAIKYLLTALALSTLAVSPVCAQERQGGSDVQIDMSILESLNPAQTGSHNEYRAVPVARPPAQKLEKPSLTDYSDSGASALPKPAAKKQAARPTLTAATPPKTTPATKTAAKPAAKSVAAAPRPAHKPAVKTASKPAIKPAQKPVTAASAEKPQKQQTRTAAKMSRLSPIKPLRGENMPAVPPVPVISEDLPPLDVANVDPENDILTKPAVKTGLDGILHTLENITQAREHKGSEPAAPETEITAVEASEMTAPAASGDVSPADALAAAEKEAVKKGQEKAARKPVFSFLKKDKKPEDGADDPLMAAKTGGVGALLAAKAKDAKAGETPIQVTSLADEGVSLPPVTTVVKAARNPATARQAQGKIPRPPPDIKNYQQEYISLAFPKGLEKLDGEVRQSLEGRVLPLLKDNPGWRLQIQAFASPTDNGPTSARRVSLSRALEVRTWLMAQGIEPQRMDVRALGMETDRDPADRVDLVFFDPVLR